MENAMLSSAYNAVSVFGLAGHERDMERWGMAGSKSQIASSDRGGPEEAMRKDMDNRLRHRGYGGEGRVCCGCGASSVSSSHSGTSSVEQIALYSTGALSQEWMFAILKEEKFHLKKRGGKQVLPGRVIGDYNHWSRLSAGLADSRRSLNGGAYSKLPTLEEDRRRSSQGSRPFHSATGKRALTKLYSELQKSPLTSGVLSNRICEGQGVSSWERRRATVAAAAVAGLFTLSLSSAAIAEPVIQRIAEPEQVSDSLGVQLEERVQLDLQADLQIQRDTWGISQSREYPSLMESRNLSTIGLESELARSQVVEDGFDSRKQPRQSTTFGEESGVVPLTQTIQKCVPETVVGRKASPASDIVAVAALGSVASAASAASRVVASTGGTALTTSLTVLHAQGPVTGASVLARAIQHFGGGGVAGALGATIVYPLDTIKTRMQAQNSKKGEKPMYKDELDCLQQLLANEGPASLYSGLLPQLLGIAPEKAMKLTVNELLMEMLETMMPGARIWALEFIAGGGGGFSQVVFTNPMEIVKVRLQTQSKEGAPKNTWDVIKELGVQGLYSGAGITMARDVPSSAIFFACYALLRQLYPDQSFMAGCVAAIPATVLVTPMDIIKTRLQKEPAPGEELCQDWWQCLQLLLQREGPQALFKGSLVRVMRTSPQFGITLMVYGLLCNGS